MANLVEYVKTVWENGKTALNAARMNNMEQGISNCATQINKLGDSVSHAPIQLGHLTGDTDWNGLDSGRYIVDNATIGESTHSPAGAYAYGVLLVSNMSDSVKLQIYVPHHNNKIFSRIAWNESYVEWTAYSGTAL